MRLSGRTRISTASRSASDVQWKRWAHGRDRSRGGDGSGGSVGGGGSSTSRQEIIAKSWHCFGAQEVKAVVGPRCAGSFILFLFFFKSGEGGGGGVFCCCFFLGFFVHFDPGGDPGASSVVNGFPTAATPPPDAAAPTAHAGPRLSQSRPAIHHHRRTRRLGFFVGGVVSFFFCRLSPLGSLVLDGRVGTRCRRGGRRIFGPFYYRRLRGNGCFLFLKIAFDSTSYIFGWFACTRRHRMVNVILDIFLFVFRIFWGLREREFLVRFFFKPPGPTTSAISAARRPFSSIKIIAHRIEIWMEICTVWFY